MKKCCSKTLLNEWKTFLNETKSLTKPKYKNGQKVKVKICCGGCAKASSTKKFTAKKDQKFSGEITANNLNNRGVTFDGDDKETKVNFVLIDIGKEGEQSFPQCCVDFGMKSNE